MTDIQTLFDQHNLTPSDIEELRDEARQVAVSCGSWSSNKMLQSSSWGILHDLSHSVWYSSLPHAEKIELGFQLYDTFPHYFHFLVPFYQLIEERALDQEELRCVIWKKFMDYLAAEPFYADPVGYVLWVEFFEDRDTVRETWEGLMKFSSDQKALCQLIKYAGPVPWELKEPLYHKLMVEQSNHANIFDSILYSAYDLYGQFDKQRAKILLSRLKVKTDTKEYGLLLEKIESKSEDNEVGT